MKLFITSPIRNQEYCLKRHLDSLDKNIEYLKSKYTDLEIEYYFITNDNTDNTEDILNEYLENKKGSVDTKVVDFLKYEIKTGILSHHVRTPQTGVLLGELRNQCLQKAIELKVDYVFMPDSDLELHKKTLHRLIKVSEDKHITTTLTMATWDRFSPTFNYAVKLGYDGLTGNMVDFDLHDRLFRDTNIIEVQLHYMAWLIPKKVLPDCSFTVGKEGQEDYGKSMEFKWFSKYCRDKDIKQLVDCEYPATHLEKSKWSLVYQG